MSFKLIYGLGIYFIIFFVGANKLDEHPSFLIINFDNQPIVILIDLKDRPIIPNCPRCIKVPGNISRFPP